MKRKDVDDIANKLGLPSVPVVFEGTLDEAKEFVSKHQMSTLNGGLHEMEYVFEQIFGESEAYIFGEGFGYKIQTNGEKYLADNKCGFIIFDINIDGWDLKRKDVDDIANKLGLPSVPVVFEGTLDEAKEFVAKHQMSTLNGGLHEMEGIVLVPRDVQLYDNKHKMIKCKCKYRDMLKAGLVKEE